MMASMKTCKIHYKCECVYIGTVEERLAAAVALKVEKPGPERTATRTKPIPIPEARPRFIDLCDPERNGNPMAYMF